MKNKEYELLEFPSDLLFIVLSFMRDCNTLHNFSMCCKRLNQVFNTYVVLKTPPAIQTEFLLRNLDKYNKIRWLIKSDSEVVEDLQIVALRNARLDENSVKKIGQYHFKSKFNHLRMRPKTAEYYLQQAKNYNPRYDNLFGNYCLPALPYLFFFLVLYCLLTRSLLAELPPKTKLVIALFCLCLVAKILFKNLDLLIEKFLSSFFSNDKIENKQLTKLAGIRATFFMTLKDNNCLPKNEPIYTLSSHGYRFLLTL